MMQLAQPNRDEALSVDARQEPGHFGLGFRVWGLGFRV